MIKLPWRKTIVVVLSLPICIAHSQSHQRIEESLKDYATDLTALDNLLVEYSDIHTLWGGLKIVVRENGQVTQEAIREEIGTPTDWSREEVKRLVNLLLEIRAWQQVTPSREPRADEGKAFLRISSGKHQVEIWEWYNEMSKNQRLIRVRELMKQQTWKQSGTTRAWLGAPSAIASVAPTR